MNKQVDGMITVSRSSGHINISIKNKKSNKRIFDAQINLKDFSKLITGTKNIFTDMIVYSSEEDELDYCKHHLKGKQCIWGLRGFCKDQPCKIRKDLRS